MIRASRSLVLCFVAATALVACNRLDKGPLEQTIMQSMAGKAHPMKSVTCPSGLDFKEQTFDCQGVDAAGKSLDFKVTVKPTSGGKADIRYVTNVDGKQFSN